MQDTKGLATLSHVVTFPTAIWLHSFGASLGLLVHLLAHPMPLQASPLQLDSESTSWGPEIRLLTAAPQGGTPACPLSR